MCVCVSVCVCHVQVLGDVFIVVGRAISEFGLAQFNVKTLLALAKEHLQSTNAAVRNGAINMLGQMHT